MTSRIYTVDFKEVGKYYHRTLLLYKLGAKSFEIFCRLDEELCLMFREAFRERVLLEDYGFWKRTIRETL